MTKKYFTHPILRLAAFAGLVLLAAIQIPNFLTLRNLMNVIKQSSIIAIPAISMTLVMIIKGIDLSTSGLIAFVPMMAIVLYQKGIPLAACILSVILIGSLIGALDGVVISKIGVPPFISTLVFGSITSGLALVLGNGGSVSGFPRWFTRIGNGSFLGIPYCNMILLIALVLGAMLLSSTPLGNRIYALGNNEQVLRQEGADTDRICIFVYGFAGFCCSVAGILLSSQLATVHPLQGTSYQLDCIAACILGGVSMFGGEGKVTHSVLGALLIGTLRNVLNLLAIHPFMQNLVLGFTIIAIVAVNILLKQRKNRFAYAL